VAVEEEESFHKLTPQSNFFFLSFFFEIKIIAISAKRLLEFF